MKPAPFAYLRPGSLAELLTALAGNADAKILAGGQSLVPMMNMRLARPETLIDINHITELQYIHENDGQIIIGSLTRYAEVLASPLIQTRLPLLAEAVSQVGYVAVRNRGTIGGSLAHNDPAAECGVALACLNAEVVLQNCGGERVVPLDRFFVTTYLTDIAADEVLREIRVPLPGRRNGQSFRELSRRVGDFAMANVAALVELDDGGKVRDAWVCFGGIGEVPLRIHLASLAGCGEPTDAGMDATVAEIMAMLDPQTDNVAGGDYKKHLAGALMRQSLARAWQLALKS